MTRWTPDHLHDQALDVELSQIQSRTREYFDRYRLPVGIRTFRVDGDALLLNDRPVYLKGFGRHEDFPVAGRGLFPPVVVKDYALLEWIGANSFRTSHYPYSEEMLALADRLLYLDPLSEEGIRARMFRTRNGRLREGNEASCNQQSGKREN